MQDIVSRFLNSHGQIISWPSKPAYKEIIVGHLSNKFENDKTYNENEVNEIIKQWHTFTDRPLLRRELVDRGFLVRDKCGYEYRKVKDKI